MDFDNAIRNALQKYCTILLAGIDDIMIIRVYQEKYQCPVMNTSGRYRTQTRLHYCQSAQTFSRAVHSTPPSRYAERAWTPEHIASDKYGYVSDIGCGCGTVASGRKRRALASRTLCLMCGISGLARVGFRSPQKPDKTMHIHTRAHAIDIAVRERTSHLYW